MPPRIGWTGSREMTPEMEQFIRRAIEVFDAEVIVITGGCVGVDAYVAAYAHKHGLHVHTILPFNRAQVDPLWRQHCTTYDEMPKGSNYRRRNQEIVRQSDRLYAVPRWPQNHPSSRRSGTWQTIRLARAANKPCYIYIA
jgi:predicted Rossmann-fold nucleotide-binding protein